MEREPRPVTAQEVKQDIDGILDRVIRQGEAFDVFVGGERIATIGPASGKGTAKKSFLELWDTRPRLEPGDADEWLEELEVARKSTTLPPPAWD